jgi:phage shock protein PspC (stress-responsive transcriptional regulator)
MRTRLFRSSTDRVIAGVCGGLAELWDFDPSFIRIGWVIGTIVTGGLLLLVYIVMAIIVPSGPMTPYSGPPIDRYGGDPSWPGGWGRAPGSGAGSTGWPGWGQGPQGPQPQAAAFEGSTTMAETSGWRPDSTSPGAFEQPGPADQSGAALPGSLPADETAPLSSDTTSGAATPEGATEPGAPGAGGALLSGQPATPATPATDGGPGWAALAPPPGQPWQNQGTWTGQPGWTQAPPPPPPGSVPPPGAVPPAGAQWGHGPEPWRASWKAAERPRERSGVGAIIFGLLLVLVGGAFLLRQAVPDLDLAVVWPVIVIIVGAILVVTAFIPGLRSDDDRR